MGVLETGSTIDPYRLCGVNTESAYWLSSLSLPALAGQLTPSVPVGLEGYIGGRYRTSVSCSYPIGPIVDRGRLSRPSCRHRFQFSDFRWRLRVRHRRRSLACSWTSGASGNAYFATRAPICRSLRASTESPKIPKQVER